MKKDSGRVKKRKVSSVLQSARYAIVNGKRVKIYRPWQVQKTLDISKPTYYKFLEEGLFVKFWPVGVEQSQRDYWITGDSVEHVRLLMVKDWSHGKALIERVSKGKKRKSKLPKVRR